MDDVLQQLEEEAVVSRAIELNGTEREKKSILLSVHSFLCLSMN
jgi:hypothetical protein